MVVIVGYGFLGLEAQWEGRRKSAWELLPGTASSFRLQVAGMICCAQASNGATREKPGLASADLTRLVLANTRQIREMPREGVERRSNPIQPFPFCFLILFSSLFWTGISCTSTTR